jgi:hypothetical protein
VGGTANRSGGSPPRHKPFVHTLPPEWKSRRGFPTGFNLEEEMATKHLNFLPLSMVILTIKVKIIIRKR